MPVQAYDPRTGISSLGVGTQGTPPLMMVTAAGTGALVLAAAAEVVASVLVGFLPTNERKRAAKARARFFSDIMLSILAISSFQVVVAGYLESYSSCSNCEMVASGSKIVLIRAIGNVKSYIATAWCLCVPLKTHYTTRD